jgi:hypothetical protein
LYFHLTGEIENANYSHCEFRIRADFHTHHIHRRLGFHRQEIGQFLVPASLGIDLPSPAQKRSYSRRRHCQIHGRADVCGQSTLRCDRRIPQRPLLSASPWNEKTALTGNPTPAPVMAKPSWQFREAKTIKNCGSSFGPSTALPAPTDNG